MNAMTVPLFALNLLSFSPSPSQVAPRLPSCEDVVAAAIEVIASSHYDAGIRSRVSGEPDHPSAFCAGDASPPEAVGRLAASIDDPAVRLVDAVHFARTIEEWDGRPLVSTGLAEVLSIDVDETTRRLTVIAPVPGSPAAAAGLRAGDVVVSIDGVATDSLGLARSVERLRVAEGATVRLVVLRNDRTRDVVLEAVALPSLESLGMDRRRKNGRDVLLLRLRQFTPGVGERLRAVVDSVSTEVDLILDLRSNPGGRLDELIAAASAFLPAGSAIGRIDAVNPTTLRTDSEPRASRIPLAVLVDAGTASAAEALAAALSIGGATLYGQRTFGKGLVHNAVPLPGGAWVLMLPVGQLETSAGRRILDHGVDPDVRTLNPEEQALMPSREMRRAVGAGGRANPRPADDAARLLEIHATILRAHRESDLEAWMAVEGADHVVANRGRITFPDSVARHAARAPYLQETRFSVYEDVRAPVVRISDDGSMGWLIAEVRAEGVRTGSDDSSETVEFVAAWIELYQRVDGAWRLVGNVSNFR